MLYFYGKNLSAGSSLVRHFWEKVAFEPSIRHCSSLHCQGVQPLLLILCGALPWAHWLMCHLRISHFVPFSEEYLESLISFLQFLTPDSLQLDKSIHDTLHDLQHSAREAHSNDASEQADAASNGNSEEGSDGHALKTLLFMWQLLMIIILLYFTFSLIQHFARYYQSILDTVRCIYFI